MHIGDQLVDHLIGYGVRHVFGCPGGQTLPLYNGIAKRADQIGHVLMRDERSAVFAADAYARATNRIGVCDATVGPGASNLVSGLVEAYCSSVPVLAIVSDIPRHWEHRRHLGSASQAFEQRRFLEGCVRWYGRVETAGNLPEILRACVRIATSGRPGPVVLEIPDDVFAADAGQARSQASPELAGFPRLGGMPDPDQVERAVALLRVSRMPIIVAGGGVLLAGAEREVRALAETLSCPLVTTLTGKGALPETHRLSGGVAGRFGIPMANALLGQSDCVVFVGSKAGQSTTLGWVVPAADTPCIQIDVDPEEIGRSYHNTIGLAADARLGAAALQAAARGLGVAYDWDLDRIAALRDAWWEGPVEYRQEPVPGVLKPQDVVRLLGGLMGEDDAIVTDASLASGWVASRWLARSAGRRCFAPRGLAGLGWGLPAAIGVSTAWRGGRGRLVCLAGDGGWGYSMAEVETAARQRLPIISVVLNNSSLAWIKHAAASRYPDGMVSEDFIEVSYADAARALGARVERVRTLEALEAALKTALSEEAGRPWVIEAISCDVETPVLPSPPSAPVKGGY